MNRQGDAVLDKGNEWSLTGSCVYVFGGGCITGNKRSILQLNVTLWPWIKCSSGLNTMKPLSSAPRTALLCSALHGPSD